MALGFDPVWFGVIIIILCEIGNVTPPVGMALYVVQGIANASTDEPVDLLPILKYFIPFFGVMLLTILLLTFFPKLVLWLPGTMG